MDELTSNFRRNASECFTFSGAELVIDVAGADDSTLDGAGVTVGIGVGVSARADAGATLGIGVGVSAGAGANTSFDLGAKGAIFLAFGCRAGRFLGAEFSFSCASG